MRLRAFLLTLLGAAVVIAGSEIALREIEQHMPVLSPWPTIETEVKSAQYEGLDPKPTLLIVGSSMTESAVDPERLVAMGAAPAAYNTAFPFFSPAAADIWLRDFLKPWDHVDVLVIGLPVWPPPADAVGDPLTMSLLDATVRGPAEDAFDGIALWRLRGMLVDIDKAARRERAAANHLWTNLGHQTVYYGRDGESVAGNFAPFGDPMMSEVQERALRRIIETARQSGATPIVLLEPGHYPDDVDDQALNAYRSWLSALVNELDVEYWDSYALDWDASFYADETHFNLRGTIEFTDYIGKRLLELRTR